MLLMHFSKESSPYLYRCVAVKVVLTGRIRFLDDNAVLSDKDIMLMYGLPIAGCLLCVCNAEGVFPDQKGK